MARPLEKILKKISTQTAVYWGAPVADGYGGYIFSNPTEIPVRWTDTIRVITLNNGEQYVCQAEIIVNQDVDLDGYLYLGRLSDLTPEEQQNPKRVSGAYQIKRFDKIPMIFKADEFMRKVYV